MSPSTVSGRSLSLCFLIPIFGLGAGIVSASAAERMPFAEHQANLATNQATLAANQVTLTSNQVYVPGSRNRLQRLDIYAPAAQVKPQPPTEPPAQLGAKPPANLAKPATRLPVKVPVKVPVKLPVIVYIHGGSFCLGDKVTSVGAMPQVFTGKGFVFVSIEFF